MKLHMKSRIPIFLLIGTLITFPSVHCASMSTADMKAYHDTARGLIHTVLNDRTIPYLTAVQAIHGGLRRRSPNEIGSSLWEKLRECRSTIFLRPACLTTRECEIDTGEESILKIRIKNKIDILRALESVDFAPNEKLRKELLSS